ncbi:MAG TPA: efflux RND transporter periplasmic adaptor subunit [Gammaproteobacteria bacterium]|nr:efflux RND transporter periplasmic adaptor subunit [Gammaproteobacteria bacterium]
MKPRYLIGAAAIVVAAVVAWRVDVAHRDAPGANAREDGYTMTVDAIKVSREAVPLVFQASGRAQTQHSVTVRAQVGGVLKKVLFQEGDRVNAGQLLFVIDQQPYPIQVEQSEGKVKQDQAKLAADQANAQRMAKLIGKQYVSAQDYENAKALVKQDEATLATDEAALDQARMQLGYTEIRAPISGKTGEITYKAGNLIDANGTAALVTINQIMPILVQFDLPQSQLPTLLRYRDSGGIKVAIADANGNTIADDGKLVFLDNAVNQGTGTLSVKALFPNKDRAVWPGELTTVILTLTVQKDALVVPTVAVQPGQNGSYVFTVESGKVKVHNVEVAREYQGMSIIDKGIQPGDTVIVRVPRELHEGLPVKTHMMTLQQAIPDIMDITS